MQLSGAKVQLSVTWVQLWRALTPGAVRCTFPHNRRLSDTCNDVRVGGPDHLVTNKVVCEEDLREQITEMDPVEDLRRCVRVLADIVGLRV